MNMKVVIAEPGRPAYITEIDNDLYTLQQVVDGCIEAFYPFDEEVCIICNDEGKYNGSEPCRAVYDDDGQLMDIVFGRFIICDCSGDNFNSLSEEQQRRYLEMFLPAERFYRQCGEIKIEKYLC